MRAGIRDEVPLKKSCINQQHAVVLVKHLAPSITVRIRGLPPARVAVQIRSDSLEKTGNRVIEFAVVPSGGSRERRKAPDRILHNFIFHAPAAVVAGHRDAIFLASRGTRRPAHNRINKGHIYPLCRVKTQRLAGLQHVGVAQWQSTGLPSRGRGFDTRHPLHIPNHKEEQHGYRKGD